MKPALARSLTLMALTAAATPAAAQFVPSGQSSAVQIYGRMDLSLNVVKAATSQSTVSSDTSLIGFRGVEKLNDGTLAYFKMEHGLSADTGAATSPTFWNREAHVGLKHASLGAIQLGSHWSPFIWITGKTDPFARSMMGAQLNLLQGSNVRGYAPTYPNSILYATPTFGGISLRAQARLGEGAANRAFATSAEYAKDRLYVGFAFESVEVPAATVGSTAGGTVRAKTAGLGVTYRLDGVRLFGYAQLNRAEGAPNAKGYVIGATVPVGAGEIRASVVRNDRSLGDSTQVALGYWYALSRRTGVYAVAASVRNDGGAAFLLWPSRQDPGFPALAAGRDPRGVQFGVRHMF